MLEAMGTTTSRALEILSEIDARIEDRHLLKHPFYRAWTAGKLPLEALGDYVSQYYHHVAAFPTYLSALHSQTDGMTIRRHILNNLVDEETGSPNHPELWMTFAERLGLACEQVESAELWPETRALIQGFRSNAARTVHRRDCLPCMPTRVRFRQCQRARFRGSENSMASMTRRDIATSAFISKRIRNIRGLSGNFLQAA